MQFHLKVYRLPEGVSSLCLRATNATAATRQAEQQGYRVIATQRQWLTGWGSPKQWQFSRRHFCIALFSQELLALLQAGLSLVESIAILARKSGTNDRKNILTTLAQQLQAGQSLSQALAAQTAVFPSLYVATLRTAEHTGDLSAALQRYLGYQRQLNLVRDKVRAASIYPVLLLSTGLLVILFLLGYVVPRFSHIYADIGGDLPWLSRLLMQWGSALNDHALALGVGLLAVVGLLVYGMTRATVRTWAARTLWSLPALGEKVRLYQLARFTRTLAMLINGGIPFCTALAMVGDLLHQPALCAGLQQAARHISEGQAVSTAFAAHGLATEIGVRLLVVGERAGNMGESLERIATLYDDDIARWVDWFTRLFEPMLMIAIGLIIGVVVLLMYLPIFELAGSMQ